MTPVENKEFSIKISKDYLSFSIAHFVLFSDSCEVLHGHNYAVSAQIGGALDAVGYVVDFGIVKKRLRAIVDALDHKIILPGEHPDLQITQADNNIEARFNGKFFSFPSDDTLVLGIKNSTAEYFAEHICGRLLDALKEAGERISWLSVEVVESPGQSATFRLELK